MFQAKKVLLLACLLMLLPSLAFAKSVTVTGMGATQADAVRDGLRQAVEQAVGALISSETVVKNYQVIQDEIYSKSQGYVQDYKVIDQQQTNDGWQVTLKVKVSTDPNSALLTRLQKLKLIDTGLGDPRIAVIIPEYLGNQPQYSRTIEMTLINKLQTTGFRRVMDASQTQTNRMQQLSRAILEGNREEAIAIATSQNLDFVIVGKGLATYAGNVLNSGMHSAQASLDLRIFKVDTGEIIGANSFAAPGADITPQTAAREAFVAVAQSSGDYLVQQLMQYAANPEKPISLVVRSISSFSRLNLLQSGLKQITGVNGVFLRSYSGGMAQFDLNYTGNARALASALEKLEGVTVQVTDVSNSMVQAVLR